MGAPGARHFKLRRGYWEVHLDALWAVLSMQGVPAEFIACYATGLAKRQTRVRINGELSDAYPMSKGVPQERPAIMPAIRSLH